MMNCNNLFNLKSNLSNKFKDCLFFIDWGEPSIYKWSTNSTDFEACATISGYSFKLSYKTAECTEQHGFICHSGNKICILKVLPNITLLFCP